MNNENPNILNITISTLIENCAKSLDSSCSQYVHLRRKNKLSSLVALLKRRNHQKNVDVLTTKAKTEKNEEISSTTRKETVISKSKDYIETISTFPDYVFFTHFKMSRQCFKKLVEELRTIWPTNSIRGRPSFQLETSLYVTLWALSNKNCYRQISGRFNLSMGCVHKIVLQTCKILTQIAPKYICWPKESEMPGIISNFENLRKDNISFPSVIGCVDVTHIRIPAPQADSSSYINSEVFHSIVLQGICDSNLIFRDVFFGCPGSYHADRVWKNSPVGKVLNNGQIRLPQDTYILGSAPLLPYLLTPYYDNGFLSEDQYRFNKIHNLILRSSIEKAFETLKSKFLILDFLNMRKLCNAKFIVISCILLHNFIRLNSTRESDMEMEKNH